MSFKLDFTHRRRLISGDYKPLVLDTKPFGCEKGATYVLDWQREMRTHDDDGVVSVAPKMPLRWIRITSVVRQVDGTWLARFDVHDNRQPALMPAWGGGYTTDAKNACDRNQAILSPEDLNRYAVEAKARRAELSERKVDQDRRRQERHIRATLRDALAQLPPLQQTVLLASLERTIRDATERKAA